MGFNYSKMSIKAPWHVAILFRMFLELSKIDQKSTKYGPSDPVFITKTLQKIQEKLWEHPWTILFSYRIIWTFENYRGYVYISFWNYGVWLVGNLIMNLLTFWKFKISKMEIGHYGMEICKFWRFVNWKMEIEISENWKWLL